MKIAVVLPRGMQFSRQGATSIDIVARDLVLKSRFRPNTYVVGAAIPDPFSDVDFRPVEATSQKRMMRGIVRKLKADLPDIVVVHQHPETAAFVAKTLRDIPVVLHRHGLLKESRGFFSRFLKARLFSKLAGVVFVSDFIQQRFLEQFPAVQPRAQVVYNGVDTTFWCPAAQKKHDIIYLGRAREDKGILPLIKAFKALSPEGWTLKLVLGVQTEAELTFADVVDKLCAGHESISITRNEQSAAVQGHLSEASIAALPSIVREGFPRAVVEAMACGCAVLATRQGGTVEAAGEAALLLEDPQSDTFEERLKTGLASLIEGQDLRQHFAAAGRSRVVNVLGLTAVAKRYDDLLERLSKN
ncbi:glycosyltransferase family 4 protein [Roseibium algae]|uniref:Glycosyltransferase family 4 protein n=1 Tax=Roseibium algae TaxID=3123038 RepID=A0ABU8TLM2_9HYPH